MNETDDDTDNDLHARLAAMEARAPGWDDPPKLIAHRRRGRFAISLGLAPLLVIGIVATAAAGAVVIGHQVTGHPGIQNPGQPLAGAHMECMTPPQAAAFLAEHGYPDVVWQVEAGDPTAGGGKGATTSTQQATPPEHGYVIPGVILDDGRPIMVVDQRVGATGVGDCYGQPMP